MFSGLNVFIVEKGIGHVQAKILKKHLLEKGGTIGSEITDAQTNVVAVQNYQNLEQYLKEINRKRKESPLTETSIKAQIIQVGFITESLRQGKRADLKIYVLKPSNGNNTPTQSRNINKAPSEKAKPKDSKDKKVVPYFDGKSDFGRDVKDFRSRLAQILDTKDEEEPISKRRKLEPLLNSSSMQKSSSPPQSPQIPLCFHNKPAILRTVNKDSENNGRLFCCCQQTFPQKRCKFFKWIDENASNNREIIKQFKSENDGPEEQPKPVKQDSTSPPPKPSNHLTTSITPISSSSSSWLCYSGSDSEKEEENNDTNMDTTIQISQENSDHSEVHSESDLHFVCTMQPASQDEHLEPSSISIEHKIVEEDQEEPIYDAKMVDMVLEDFEARSSPRLSPLQSESEKSNTNSPRRDDTPSKKRNIAKFLKNNDFLSPSWKPQHMAATNRKDLSGFDTDESSETPPSPPMALPSQISNNNNTNQDSDSEESLDPLSLKLTNQKMRWRNAFACQKTPAQMKEFSNKNVNQEITDILQKLENNSNSSGDKWRSYAYRKAITAIKAYPKKIETLEEAKSIRGVGARIATKIGEILETGKLRQAEIKDDKMNVMEILSKVWGAGPHTVNKWIAHGIKTLEDLHKNDHLLTYQQRIGLKYYEEFQLRIPRDEVAQIEAVVQEHAHKFDKNLKAVACGSYRRGKKDCGDVDIIITHKKAHNVEKVLPPIIRSLRGVGFLTDDLTTSWEKESDKYMGVCMLQGHTLHRRIDIRVYPLNEWPCALLYFTGSGHFNRSMRLWARKNGYHLSDHSINKRFADDMEGEPIPVKTEEDIFRILGLEYKPPEERDV